MQVAFGAGVLYATQLLDAQGNVITNPTPQRFGILQEVSLDISFENKLLYGSSQFPVAVGRGKGKIGGKCKAAQFNGSMLNAFLFGQTLATGQQVIAVDEGPTPVPVTPFNITVTNAATFIADLGVYNAATGIQMKRVAAAPTAGQYSVNTATGVYLFSSADNVSAISVKINYNYAVAGTGNKSTIGNLPMGYAPSFKADLTIPYQGKTLMVSLPNCISNKFSLATKLDDFIVPEFTFDAFADAGGNVLTYSLVE